MSRLLRQSRRQRTCCRTFVKVQLIVLGSDLEESDEAKRGSAIRRFIYMCMIAERWICTCTSGLLPRCSGDRLGQGSGLTGVVRMQSKETGLF